jgi:hypothetical protein
MFDRMWDSESGLEFMGYRIYTPFECDEYVYYYENGKITVGYWKKEGHLYFPEEKELIFNLG